MNDNMQKMTAARLKKELQTIYRFSSGIMTLEKYLGSKELTERVLTIRNHAKKKVNFEYKKIRDTQTYNIFWGDAGMEVSKLVFDFYDWLPVRISDNRFD